MKKSSEAITFKGFASLLVCVTAFGHDLPSTQGICVTAVLQGEQFNQTLKKPRLLQITYFHWKNPFILLYLNLFIKI